MEIWTDGSCLGNPGFGGWGAISEAFEISGASSGRRTISWAHGGPARTRTVQETDVKDVIVWTDSFTLRTGSPPG